MIHFLAGLQNLLRLHRRRRISFFKINAFINVRKLLHTKTLSALFMKLLCKWHKIRPYLLPETLHLFFSVGITHHPIITKLYKIFISHFSGLLCTVFYQLIVKLVQLIRNTFKKCTVFLPRKAAYITVLARHIRTQQGKIQFFSLPVNLRRCDQFIITVYKCIFILHQRNK